MIITLHQFELIVNWLGDSNVALVEIKGVYFLVFLLELSLESEWPNLHFKRLCYAILLFANDLEDVVHALNHECSDLFNSMLLIYDHSACMIEFSFLTVEHFPQIVEGFNHVHLLVLEHFDDLFWLGFEESECLWSCFSLDVLNLCFHCFFHWLKLLLS